MTSDPATSGACALRSAEMKILLTIIFALVPLLSWSEIDRVSVHKPNGDMLGEIVAKNVCQEWVQAFDKPEKQYQALSDPVSMPSPLVAVVFWTGGVPVRSAQVLCYDSIVSSEVAKAAATGTKVEIPLTYVIGKNKSLTRLVVRFLKKEAKEYLESLDPRSGLTPENLLEKAGLEAEQAAP